MQELTAGFAVGGDASPAVSPVLLVSAGFVFTWNSPKLQVKEKVKGLPRKESPASRKAGDWSGKVLYTGEFSNKCCRNELVQDRCNCNYMHQVACRMNTFSFFGV